MRQKDRKHRKQDGDHYLKFFLYDSSLELIILVYREF